MISITNVAARLKREFPPDQAQLLAEELNFAHEALAKASDLTELKEIVREIGQGQQRSEARMDKLEITMQELAEAQKRTEIKVGELTEAQKRTEVKMEELADAQKLTEAELRQLAHAQKNTQQEVGGLANTLGYMLENEAYRHLPKVLAGKHGIRISSKFIRQQVGSEEINLLAEGTRNRKPVLIVGESKTRLAAKNLSQLKLKIKEVEKHYPPAAKREIVPVMIVHFARDKELKRAELENVIVIQSFEW